MRGFWEQNVTVLFYKTWSLLYKTLTKYIQFLPNSNTHCPPHVNQWSVISLRFTVPSDYQIDSIVHSHFPEPCIVSQTLPIASTIQFYCSSKRVKWRWTPSQSSLKYDITWHRFATKVHLQPFSGNQVCFYFQNKRKTINRKY